MAKSEGQLEFERRLKEQKMIELENKLLAFGMPIVGLIAFILGLTGFILIINSGNVPVMVSLIILFLLGIGGMVYGLVQLIKYIKSKHPKESEEDADE